MKIQYCLPIIATKKDEVLEMINKNYARYSFFEVWIDYISDLDIKFVQNMIEEYEDKIIIVFRRQKLNTIEMTVETRVEIIKKLSGKPTMLDFDITQKEELDFIKKSNLSLNLIMSHHNYIFTPSNEELTKIIASMKVFNPTIYKIATLCEKETDALRLLTLLLQLKQQGIRCIMLGMGKHGAITRIFGTLWGNEMIFAPVTKESETAPDMLTREQLDSIFEQLAIRN